MHGLNFPAGVERSAFPLDWAGPVDRHFRLFPEEDLSRPVIGLFTDAVLRNPLAIALDDGVNRITYDAALRQVRYLAGRIVAETNPGALVGILLPTSSAFSIAMLACFAAGRPFVPIDLHYPAAWIAEVLEAAGIAAVIAEAAPDEVAPLLSATVRVIDIAASMRGDDSAEMAIDDVTPLGPDEPALVLFTSGSTGRPKGIVNSQRNLLRRTEQYINAAHISPDDRFLPLSSECTIAGIRERLTALLAGAQLHLIDVQRQGARQIAAVLREKRISMIYAVPALLRSLMQLEGVDAPGSLRVVRVGGDTVLWDDIDRLYAWLPSECLIELGYSSTEAPIMQWFVPRDFPRERSRIPIGYPISGNSLAILDDDGLAVPPGEIGELVLTSPYIALGRWVGGRCDGTDFPPDPARPGCRVQHTDDLARERPDGFIDLIGRKDRQIKIRGQRVEPAEIEAALLRHPEILEAAIFARRGAPEIRLIAYAVTRSEAAPAIQGLKTYLRDTLPAALQPHRIYFLPALPRLPSAKLDMKALQAIDADHCREGEPPHVETEAVRSDDREVETTVAAIWRRVLKRETIARDLNFFDIGGDSLAVITLMFEIEQALGVELPVTMIYQAPSIASLSKAIKEHSEAQFSPIVLMKDGDGAPPFFIVHGVGGNVMELFGVGRRIAYPGKVYAVQAVGLDGKSEPHRRIGDLAEDYLAAIRSVQPAGPYKLGGYSYGGLVALEMAQRLKTSGETVGLLALLDTTTNPRQWPLRLWVGHLLERSEVHRKSLRGLSMPEKSVYLRKTFASFIRTMNWRIGRVQSGRSELAVSTLPPALARVRNAIVEAASAYQAPYYDGVIVLIRSALGDPHSCDPLEIWRGRAHTLDLHTVPGNHTTMIEGENGRQLAVIVSRYLNKI